MNIICDKICLRAIEKEDSEFLRGMVNDAEIESQIGGWSFPVSKEKQNLWIESIGLSKDSLRLIIEFDGQRVGYCALTNIDQKNASAEIHIKIAHPNRGQGLGTSAIKTLVKYAFDELRLNCVYANVLSYNIGSLKAFEKNGFVKEGLLRKRVFKNGRFVDVFSLSVIKGEQK